MDFRLGATLSPASPCLEGAHILPPLFQFWRPAQRLELTELGLLVAGMGAAYGTAKSGVGIASMGVMRPELVMKSIVPVVMAGVLGIYGLIIAVIISTGGEFKPFFPSQEMRNRNTRTQWSELPCAGLLPPFASLSLPSTAASLTILRCPCCSQPHRLRTLRRFRSPGFRPGLRSGWSRCWYGYWHRRRRWCPVSGLACSSHGRSHGCVYAVMLTGNLHWSAVRTPSSPSFSSA